MRWIAWVLTLIVMLGLNGTAQQPGMTVSGRIGATDQEVQEGYFAIDAQTMIVVKPGTEIHAYLRARVGQRVKLTLEPASASE